MKKILLSFTAILLLPVFNLAWAGLFMVGEAVSDDWGTRLAMTETQEGIFTRIVRLQNGELKFVESADEDVWFPQYVAQDGNVNMGKNDYVSVGMYCREDGNSQYADNNYKFEAGDYVITVNANDGKMAMTVCPLATDLYIVGEAVGGRELLQAILMQATDGKFVYTGHLGSGGFKFITGTRGWNPCYVAGSDQQAVVPGEWADMVYRLDTSAGQAADYNFLIADEGLYTVEVDMSSSAASPKMKVTKEESNPHIIGDVVGGFDLDNATPMTRLSDEVYVWNGQLEAGLFKFVCTPLSLRPVYTAAEAASNIAKVEPEHSAAVVYSPDYSDDNFYLEQAGDYRISLQIGENPSMTVSKMSPDSLFIVGGATPSGWNAAGAIPMHKKDDGSFVWTGILKGDTGANDFKFLTNKADGGFLPCYVATQENLPVQSGNTYSLEYRAKETETLVSDYKFTVEERAFYSIEVSFADEKPRMTVTKAQVPKKLYLVGDKTGWEMEEGDKPVLMVFDPAETAFKWSGELPHGEVKFLVTDNSWFPCYVAENGLTIVTEDRVGTGYEFNLIYRTEDNETEGPHHIPDYKFFFYEGTYEIILDFSGEKPVMKVSGTVNPLNMDAESLQIAGGATPGGWTPSPMPCLQEKEGGGFVYTAVLKAGSNNTFKFRWADGWWPSLIATWGERTECSVGGEYEYDLAYMPNDNYDWQFYLDEEAAGKDVVVHVDLEEMKMSVLDDPVLIEEARGKQIRTWSDGKHVMIENVDGDYSVTGLNGESHNGVADGSGIVDVEVNCNGVYVVTANCLSKRVLVY